MAHTTTFLTELSLFGRLLRERTEAEVIFYCSFAHPVGEQFARQCAGEGVICLVEPLAGSMEMCFGTQRSNKGEASSKGANLKPLLRKLLKRAMAALPRVGQEFLRERAAFVARAGEIQALLAVTAPALVVLGGDMVGYDSSLYIKRAHDLGVKVLIVPSTMSNGLEQAEVYSKDPSYWVTGLVGELIARALPKWVVRHKGRRIFRCPPGRALAMELGGLAPPKPWVFNSGSADAIAMESEAMVEYYVAAGLDRRPMVLTGALSDDSMAERVRNAAHYRQQLCAELGLDSKRPLILSALPPDFFYLPGGRPECDFANYEELEQFWIDSLAALKGCSKVVALHPSVDADSMRRIERGGIRIGRWKTADMVPLCDVYVASVSSTIRWAIACGKPVVNYDVYRYRYTDFLGVPGVLATESRDMFRALLDRLVGDGPYREQIAQAQQQVAAKWGILDGFVGGRMLGLVERLGSIRKKRGNFDGQA